MDRLVHLKLETVYSNYVPEKKNLLLFRLFFPEGSFWVSVFSVLVFPHPSSLLLRPPQHPSCPVNNHTKMTYSSVKNSGIVNKVLRNY